VHRLQEVNLAPFFNSACANYTANNMPIARAA